MQRKPRIKICLDGCWEWLGARHLQGYGLVKRNGSIVGAHRLAWRRAHSHSIPPGMNVLHKCDNPPCVNPSHLELGTDSENLAQAWRRGRRTRKR